MDSESPRSSALPSSGILNNWKTQRFGSVSVFRSEEGEKYSVGSLRKSLLQSLDPTECLPTLTWRRKHPVSEALFPSYLEFRTMDSQRYRPASEQFRFYSTECGSAYLECPSQLSWSFEKSRYVCHTTKMRALSNLAASDAARGSALNAGSGKSTTNQQLLTEPKQRFCTLLRYKHTCYNSAQLSTA
jgi:hypothetical protein